MDIEVHFVLLGTASLFTTVAICDVTDCGFHSDVLRGGRFGCIGIFWFESEHGRIVSFDVIEPVSESPRVSCRGRVICVLKRNHWCATVVTSLDHISEQVNLILEDKVEVRVSFVAIVLCKSCDDLVSNAIDSVVGGFSLRDQNFVFRRRGASTRVHQSDLVTRAVVDETTSIEGLPVSVTDVSQNRKVIV